MTWKVWAIHSMKPGHPKKKKNQIRRPIASYEATAQSLEDQH